MTNREISEIFNSKLRNGKLTRATACGFFNLSDTGDLTYHEPNNHVVEFHGNIFQDDYLSSAAALLEYFSAHEQPDLPGATSPIVDDGAKPWTLRQQQAIASNAAAFQAEIDALQKLNLPNKEYNLRLDAKVNSFCA